MFPDAHLLPYLDALSPAPHNSVVLVTSLSPSTLLSLFDLASSPPSSPPSPSDPSSPPPPTIPPQRKRSHGFLYRLIKSLLSLALKALLLIALFALGKKLWVRYKAWSAERDGVDGAAGRVRLEENDEVDLDLGSEDEAEGEAEAWHIAPRSGRA